MNNSQTIANHYKVLQFDHKPEFNQIAICIIDNKGAGISNICLRVDLPQLPYGYVYKQHCHYRLIKRISLVIGGNIFFKYNSEQLQNLDTILNKTLIPITNNIFYYHTDLQSFFGHSKRIKGSMVSLLDDSYQGIRLCDLDKTKIKLNFKFGDILDIIEPDNEIENYIDGLSDLKINNAFLIAYYEPSSKIHITNDDFSCRLDNIVCSTTDNKCQSEQEITQWVPGSCIMDSNSKIQTFQLLSKLPEQANILSEIFIFSEPSYSNFLQFSLQLNGLNCFDSAINNEISMLHQFTTYGKIYDDILIYPLNIEAENVNNFQLSISNNMEPSTQKIVIQYIIKIRCTCLYKNGTLQFPAFN